VDRRTALSTLVSRWDFFEEVGAAVDNCPRRGGKTQPQRAISPGGHRLAPSVDKHLLAAVVLHVIARPGVLQFV
jgi:hypothetical protein